MVSNDRLHDIRCRAETWTDIYGDGATMKIHSSELEEIVRELLAFRSNSRPVVQTKKSLIDRIGNLLGRII